METGISERTSELETEKNQISNLLETIFPKEAIEELKTTGKVTPPGATKYNKMMAVL